MTVELEKPSPKTMSNTGSGEASVSSTGDQTPPPKKKRNQAGMPDPEAEVIALSPKTLMATNRFLCEICNKGFQRDQNLQLHRRGHNLPWKLRQRSTKEVRKRVYVCPEATCVHHDPARALGDLTGIKKHFCRKHGEKKFKCEKCAKNYAVQSDWKAHNKICGTKEYKCDCGTMFSRRDSFITHRAFCDALTVENTKSQPPPPLPPPSDDIMRDIEEEKIEGASSPLPPQPLPSPPPSPASPATPVVASVLPIQNADKKMPEFSANVMEKSTTFVDESPATAPGLNSACSTSTSGNSGSSTRNSVFASLFSSSAVSGSVRSQPPVFSNYIQAIAQPEPAADFTMPSCIEPISLCLSTNHSSIFAPPAQERIQFPPPPRAQPSLLETSHLQKAATFQDIRQYAPPPPPPQPAMSATALLQKAAQMGSTAGGGSLLLGLGLVSSSSSASGQQANLPWYLQQGDMKRTSIPPGLHLTLPGDEGSGLKELMMGSSPNYGPKHQTVDFMGLGMALGASPNSNLPGRVTPVGGGIDMTAATVSFGSAEFGSKDYGQSL